MSFGRNTGFVMGAALLATVGFTAFAQAQSAFPTRPVSMIVPFPPGGAADQPARMIGKSLTGVWKQSVLTVNRPGAGGSIGTAAVVNAPADGYTLLATNPSLLAIPEADKLLDRQSSFDRGQFKPLALLVADPVLLVVKADAPWRTYEEFVAAAKAAPDTITYASSGAYSATHLPIEMLAHAAGVKLRHVPYSGGGPSILAVLGGQVAATATSPQALAGHLQSGALRALVSTGAKRIDAVPSVPTAHELGYGDVEYYIWIGLFASAKTPEPLIRTLRDAVDQAMQGEDGFAQGMARAKAAIDYRPGATFEQFLERDAERIRTAIQRIGRVE